MKTNAFDSPGDVPHDAARTINQRLWNNVSTPFNACYQVLGIPLVFGTNAAELIHLADETFGSQRLTYVQAWNAVRLNCFLHDVPESSPVGEASAPICRVQGDHYLMTFGGSLGFADKRKRYGVSFVTSQHLHVDRTIVQQRFLETLALFLLTRYRPATFHAAGLSLEGHGVLLTGETGAGKSTMAYSCLRAGFDLLAEDEVFINPRTPIYAYGQPQYVHLRTDSPCLFPELQEVPMICRADDDPRLRLRTEEVRPGSAISRMRMDGVLLLERATGAHNRLLRVDQDRLRRALTQYDHSRPLNVQAQGHVLSHVLAGRTARIEIAEGRVREAAEMVKDWLMDE